MMVNFLGYIDVIKLVNYKVFYPDMTRVKSAVHVTQS